MVKKPTFTDIDSSLRKVKEWAALTEEEKTNLIASIPVEYLEQLYPKERVRKASILRQCKVCGLTASNDEELKQFKPNKRSWFGVESICKKCYKGDRYCLTFLDERIWLDHDPREPKCSCCDLTEDLLIHHDAYDLDDPLAYTRTLNRKCHNKWHSENPLPPIIF